MNVVVVVRLRLRIEDCAPKMQGVHLKVTSAILSAPPKRVLDHVCKQQHHSSIIHHPISNMPFHQRQRTSITEHAKTCAVYDGLSQRCSCGAVLLSYDALGIAPTPFVFHQNSLPCLGNSLQHTSKTSARASSFEILALSGLSLSNRMAFWQTRGGGILVRESYK